MCLSPLAWSKLVKKPVKTAWKTCNEPGSVPSQVLGQGTHLCSALLLICLQSLHRSLAREIRLCCYTWTSCIAAGLSLMPVCTLLPVFVSLLLSSALHCCDLVTLHAYLHEDSVVVTKELFLISRLFLFYGSVCLCLIEVFGCGHVCSECSLSALWRWRGCHHSCLLLLIFCIAMDAS